MAIGYHVIFGAYGFSLPNDPRGWWWKYVGARNLSPVGTALKLLTRQSVAAESPDHPPSIGTRNTLKYPPVRFTGSQARAIIDGFASLAELLQLPVYACSIMRDHAQLVLGLRRRNAEEIAELLKRAATRRLNELGVNPMQSHSRRNGRTPSPWGKRSWYVFINTPQQMRGAIEYVEMNPMKAGMRRQNWSFVAPYAG